MSGEGPIPPPPGSRATPIDLPAKHLAILRRDLTGVLEGAREDLEAPEELPDAERSRLEATVFERLLAEFDRGEILLPDEDARTVMGRMAEGFDKANDYEVITATHNAHHGLLALLDREAGR